MAGRCMDLKVKIGFRLVEGTLPSIVFLRAGMVQHVNKKIIIS